MAWDSSVEHNRPIFPRCKPERPYIDIESATAQRNTGVGSVADNEALRTPIDKLSTHSDTPWYNPSFTFNSYEQLRIPNTLESLPPDVHYRVSRGLQVYDEFRSMDLDVVPSSPPRGMLELHDSFDERELEFSPPSPSHRSLTLPEPVSSRYPRGYNNDRRDLPSIGANYDLPSQSPPSPSRRALDLIPEDWIMDDCPELSPPSPRQGCLGLPALNDDFNTEPLFDHEYYNETPSLRATPSSSSSLSLQSSPLTLSARLDKEHRELEDLQIRTEQSERFSRARTMNLRTHERSLARAVAERTSRARETKQSTSEGQSLAGDTATPGTLSVSSGNPEALSTADLLQSVGSNKEIVRFYRMRATRLMLDRIEEKRRRKKAKERLKELRVILGPGTDALLDLANAADEKRRDLLDEEEAEREGGLGLGLVLEQPKAIDTEKEAAIAAELAERHRAIRRLVAHMTIRRRELERRGLLEAGNLAEAYLNENENSPKEETQMDVESSTPLLKPDLSYLAAKRQKKGESPLRKEVDLSEDIEELQESFEEAEEMPEESGLLFGF
ncbi:hypothetical protein M422DRAFT_24540 [Sphaerobolus stellatus SS14]|nr:hypothetical protein M422DRAFT_24540 [Sphaerobolus stellatus SS14]